VGDDLVRHTLLPIDLRLAPPRLAGRDDNYPEIETRIAGRAARDQPIEA
jgi:hypothetical protein